MIFEKEGQLLFKEKKQRN